MDDERTGFIDDFQTPPPDPDPWRLITDGVMGGASKGRLRLDDVGGRPALRLAGDVSLQNDGGSSRWPGNGQDYSVHLRTSDLSHPWQSYQAFNALPHWQTLRIALRR